MKNIKKLAAIILMLTMLLSLAGCGKSPLIGKWQGEVDIADLMIKSMNDGVEETDEELQLLMSYADIGDYIKSMPLVMTMEFKSDGTYSEELDRASFEECIDDLKDAISSFYSDVFELYLIDLLNQQGIACTSENLEQILGMSVDDAIVSSMGMDISTYASGIIDESLDFHELESEMNTEGKFRTNGNKLFLSLGLENDVDPQLYDYFSVDGNTLTISLGTNFDEYTDMMYPFVLEKVR